MNWTDILICIIMGSNMIYGLKKGLITTTIGLFKWIVGIAVSKIFYIEFTDFAKINFYDPSEKIYIHVHKFISGTLMPDIPNDIPLTSEQARIGIEKLNLPSFYQKGLDGFEGNLTFVDFINEISLKLTEMTVYVMGFFLLLLLIMSLLGIVEVLFNQLAKLPVIKEFNKGGGLILGGILGLISIYFFMILLNVFITFEWSRGIIAAIQQSQFAIYFYKYNILQYFLVGFMSNLYKGFLML